ncbi:MAG: fatty acid desaturase [Gemmataceae bacterium]
MPHAGTFFRFHPADALLAVSGLGHVAFIVATAWCFPGFGPWLYLAAFVSFALLICWNLQCISHNFIHNPFFTWRWLNRAFGVLETLAIGMPHQLYHHYHMNHHQGNNDARGPDGSTRDWSSIYRHSRDDRPEPFWRYCLLSFFRVEVGPVLRVAIRHGRANIAQVVVETLALVAFWGALAAFDWWYFVAFYLPAYFFGWVLSYAEGYLEHYGAKPGNPYADSVSSYHPLYNLLWFNNGYHQEHHWDPRRHWTQMHTLHQEIAVAMKVNGTRVLRGPHMTGLIEDWLDAHTSGQHTPVQEQRRAA